MDNQIILQEANYVNNLECFQNAIKNPRGLQLFNAVCDKEEALVYLKISES